MNGLLTARYDGEMRKCKVSGINTSELTMKAIKKIMNKACKSPIWAKGRIILTDEKGIILHEMKEKN